ncbi:hypothetical protein EJB05_15480, partial [Eragrostis curvula]
MRQPAAATGAASLSALRVSIATVERGRLRAICPPAAPPASRAAFLPAGDLSGAGGRGGRVFWIERRRKRASASGSGVGEEDGDGGGDDIDDIGDLSTLMSRRIWCPAMASRRWRRHCQGIRSFHALPRLGGASLRSCRRVCGGGVRFYRLAFRSLPASPRLRLR